MVTHFCKLNKVFVICFLFSMALMQQRARAESFNFYEQKCTEAAELGCKANLVVGTTCLVAAQGACKEFERIQHCGWQAAFLGLPIWTCEVVNGACKTYEQVCTEFNKVCNAGYKEVCKSTLRPFSQIKDELVWVAYQQYMQNIGSRNKGPLHTSVIALLQPFYQSDLRKVTVSVGKSSLGDGMTDCYDVHFPSDTLVRALQQGVHLISNKERQWVLHELKHADQCTALGGRKKYAIMWFGQLEITSNFRPDLIVADFLTTLNNKSMRSVHDAMPMEKDAERFAEEHIHKIQQASLEIEINKIVNAKVPTMKSAVVKSTNATMEIIATDTCTLSGRHSASSVQSCVVDLELIYTDVLGIINDDISRGEKYYADRYLKVNLERRKAACAALKATGRNIEMAKNNYEHCIIKSNLVIRRFVRSARE